jgi:hypothetical protein
VDKRAVEKKLKGGAGTYIKPFFLSENTTTRMLKLISLTGVEIELPYKPDMPIWKYLRDIVAPTAGFEIVDGKTVRESIIANGQRLGFRNKHKLLHEMVEDGGKLCNQRPLGPSHGDIYGNACEDGGNTWCAVCLEDSYDFSLRCMHRFHGRCVKGVRLCPLCRAPFTQGDISQLQFY